MAMKKSKGAGDPEPAGLKHPASRYSPAATVAPLQVEKVSDGVPDLRDVVERTRSTGTVKYHRPVSQGSTVLSSSPSPIFPPTGTVSVTPLLVEGKLVRVSRHGVNGPVLGYVGKDRVVFKQEMARHRGGEEARINSHMKAVVASRIMKAFGVPTVEYAPACLELESGEKLQGIVSEYVECKNLYEDPSLLFRVSNPDEAVAGNIVNAWIGDSDRIVNDGNVWVTPEGKVVLGDYGYAFRRKVTALGLPKSNLKVMECFATRENVNPVIRKITALTDEEIVSLVQRASQGLEYWNPQIEKEIIAVLIQNRDELREENPFAIYYGDRPAGGEQQSQAGGRSASIALRPEVMKRVRHSLLLMGSHVGSDREGEIKPLQEEPEKAESVGRGLRMLGKEIQGWNSDLEQRLLSYLLSMSERDDSFTADPEQYYAVLHLVRRCVSSEEILRLSLGII